MGYERQCDNWIKDFGRWTMPRSEAPETFIFWTGVFNIAAALRRNVKVPKKYLGSWECAPNLYIMFVAPAGKKKSTTLNYSEELIAKIHGVTRSPDLITKEALLTTLIKSDDASMCILAPEFSEFMVKSGVEMYGWLTNMYDGKKDITASTLTRGLEQAQKPCVNLIGATTPEWLAANMPESVLGGGFASRVIFIYEDNVRRRQMYYEGIDQDALGAIGDKLVSDLDFIANNLYGDFAITEDAKDFMEHWYRNNADVATAAQYKLSGYYERRPAHIHKVAMCLHVAYSNDLVIEQKDFEDAIALLAQIEKKLPKTFQSIGKNPYTVDLGRMLDYIREKKTVKKGELLAQFRHAATPHLLDELIIGLQQSGAIEIIVEGPELLLRALDLTHS